MQTWHLIAACLKGLRLVNHFFPTSSFSRIKNVYIYSAPFLCWGAGGQRLWSLSSVGFICQKQAVAPVGTEKGGNSYWQLLVPSLPATCSTFYEFSWLQQFCHREVNFVKGKKYKEYTQLTCGGDLNPGKAEFNLLHFPNTVLYDAINLCVRWYSKVKFTGIRY